MLWKIDGTNLHILGSVHLANRTLNVSEETLLLINNASTIAFESNLDFNPQIKSCHYEKGNCLSKNVAPDLFSKTFNLLCELGFPPDEIESYKPWHAAFTIINAILAKHEFSRDKGIDRYVLELGKKNRQNFFYLESAESGLAPFIKSPPIEQEIFLRKTALDTNNLINEVTSIINAWESSDLTTLQSVADKAHMLMPIIYSNLLGGRNKAWLPQIIRLAKSQKNILIVVGALHMMKKESIPELLAIQGFNCFKI